MEELETTSHIIVEGGFLIKRTLSLFRNDSHGELLGAHLPDWSLNMDDRRGAEETLFAAIRFLRDGGMQTHYSGHRYDARGVLGDMIAYSTTNFGMRIFQFPFVKLTLTVLTTRRLIAEGR